MGVLISPEIAIGTVTIIGATAYALKKMGLINFSPNPKETCPLHNNMQTLVENVKTIQQQNCEKHKQHEKELERGERSFHEIRADISELHVGVGILLERTGGTPESYRKKR